MLISELIAELEKLKAENGDIRTTILGDYGDYFSFECFIGLDEEADNEKVVVFY